MKDTGKAVTLSSYGWSACPDRLSNNLDLSKVKANAEGNIYEIIVYNERLKQSEIDSIKNYLIGRYIRP